MSDSLLILGVQLAGALHFVTLLFAWFTPIPPDWDKTLATLPAIHRRFALAQNASGTVSIDGSVAGRCLFTVPNQTISLVELLAGE